MVERKKRAYKPKPKNVLPFSIGKDEHSLWMTLPIRTVSEANNFDHWSTKARRHKMQKGWIAMALSTTKSMVNLPCKITITRVASRMLDQHDNLPMSLKYITDAICEELTGIKQAGQADNDERIKIEFKQEKSSTHGVKVLIEFFKVY
jgi:hypothetical protein